MKAITITATPDELEALLQLARRAPMSLPESLFVEGVFSRWQVEMIGAMHASQPNNNGAGAPVNVSMWAQSDGPPDTTSEPLRDEPS